MKQNTKNIFYLIVAIFTLLSAVIVLYAFLEDGARDISPQVQALNNSAQMVRTDFENLRQIDNTEVTIADEQITVIFKAKDCELTAVYNNNMELVSSKLQDMRIGRNIEALIVAVVVMSGIGGMTGYVLVWLGYSLYSCYKKLMTKIKK